MRKGDLFFNEKRNREEKKVERSRIKREKEQARGRRQRESGVEEEKRKVNQRVNEKGKTGTAKEEE